MIFEILIGGVGVAAGIFVGIRAARGQADDTAEAAALQASRIQEEARRSAALMLREAQAQANEDTLEIERGAEVHLAAVVEQCDRLEVRNAKAESRQSEERKEIEARQEAVDGRFEALAKRREATKERREEIKRLRRLGRAILEKGASVTAEELRDGLVDQMVVRERDAGADRLRNIEHSGIDFMREAKRVMGIAMQRYTGYCPRDRGVASMALAEGQCARLRDEFGPLLEALAEFSDVAINLPDEGDTLRLESSDGVARELCRRVLARSLKDGKVREPAKLMAAVKRDLDREISDLGRRALKRLRLGKAHDEVVELIGQLNWRTSYTQNQYKHAIEAAALAGLIASELGLDPRVARRSALLHDLGKAMTHNVEGSHALNGAEVAERCGEDKVVVNAIAAHHGEVPMETAHAWLAAATDAMSGGRPGARREITESYGDRIGDLERIARAFRGVASVHAMQAGREVRVFVDDAKVDDARLDEISENIASKISDEMTFPGQIRVTVIREFRATAVAN